MILVARVRGPRTEAAVQKAVQRDVYGSYGEVISEVGGGAGEKSIWQQRSEMFCWGWSRSVLSDEVYQRSTVPGAKQGKKKKGRGRSKEGKCAVESFKKRSREEFSKHEPLQMATFRNIEI